MSENNVSRFERPVRWEKPRMDELEKVIRSRSKQTENVIISDHAFDRVEERDITQQDVYNILRTGVVLENIENVSKQPNTWKVQVMKALNGGYRQAIAVTLVVKDDDHLFVKTVMWRDL